MAASVWSGYLNFWSDFDAGAPIFRRAQHRYLLQHAAPRLTCSGSSSNTICPAENRVVERSEIVKGYEFRKDEYIVIEPEEIKKIEPQTAKTMEILEFVKASDVDPVYFESSYYMVPDEAGRRPYALLTKALKRASTSPSRNSPCTTASTPSSCVPTQAE